MSMQSNLNPKQQLVTLRIIWAALLMGVVTFGVVVRVIGPQQPSHDPAYIRLLFHIAIAEAATAIPVGWIVRKLIYRKGTRDGVVAPAAYATGNIIFWAMCEGSTFFSLVGALLNQGRGPHLILAAITTAIQLFSFPTGKPLRGDDSIRPIHNYDSKI